MALDQSQINSGSIYERAFEHKRRRELSAGLPEPPKREPDALDAALVQFCDAVHVILSPQAAAAAKRAKEQQAAATGTGANSLTGTTQKESQDAAKSKESAADGAVQENTGGAAQIQRAPIHPPEQRLPLEEKDEEFIRKYPTIQLAQFLGRGQAGSVFLGEDEGGKPVFAIKAIHLPGAVGIGLPIRKTFLLYQKVLRKLDHPHVNPYLGWTVIENEGQVYTAYCNEGTMRDRIYGGKAGADSDVSATDRRIGGIQDAGLVRRWLREILSGLEYLHAHGIVHRDVKPGNILLHDGVCRVADLGSARLHQHCCGDSHQKRLSGTPAYAAPEAVVGRVAFETAGEDVWGVGCVLFEMVLGEQPWAECENIFAIYYELGRLFEANCADPAADHEHPLVMRAAASGRFDASGLSFLAACLRWDPRDRPTARELLAHPFLN